MMTGKPMRCVACSPTALLVGLGRRSPWASRARCAPWRAEELAVLRRLDGGQLGADHLDAVALEGAVVREGHGQVEPGLAAEGGQQGVGPLALDDLGHDLGGERLDVGAVGELRVGHDGGRIAS